MEKDHGDTLKKRNDEILDLDTKLTNLQGIEDKWKKFEAEKEDLIKQRDEEKRMRAQEVNEKER